MFTEAFGATIRDCRIKAGLRQADIADALHITSQAVSKWERGETAPDISVLPQLASILAVSIDSLFGFSKANRVVEATVFSADIEDFTKRAGNLDPEEAARVLNGHYVQLTECILRLDGVPIKYIGDEFLCYFSGQDHRLRAVQAALTAREVVSEKTSIGLACGNIFIGMLGHPDYARLDILGLPVQNAFGISMWARKSTATHIGAPHFVVEPIQDSIVARLIEQKTAGDKEIRLYEITGLTKAR